MSTCPTCGADYRVQQSMDAQQRVRNVCKCESKRACGYHKKGKAPCGVVRQALLDPDGIVEIYACEAHAAQDALDDPAPPKAKAPRASKNAAEPYKKIETVDDYVASVANLDYPLICLRCLHRHAFNARVVELVILDGHRSFERRCPNCNVGVYDGSGPPWEETYKSAADYDNPPPEKEAPKPASPAKKRK